MMKRVVLVLLAVIAFAIPTIALAAVGISIDSAYASSWIIVNDRSEYSPARMIDGDGTTSFQFSTNEMPLGQAYIYFYLKGPSDFDTLWIRNGFQRMTAGYDQYLRNCRVKKMSVAFQYSGDSGYYDALNISIPDQTAPYGWTWVDIGLHTNVTAVRFLIKEIYVGSKYRNDVCISEVAFTREAAASSSSSSSASRDAWVKAYHQFFTSGTYKTYIDAVESDYAGVLSERNTKWDCASLYDLDANGIPELLIRVEYGNEQADVFTYSNGRVVWQGTIGGDNFFQDFFYYPNSNQDGLFVASGGMAMRIRKYKLNSSRVSCTEIGKTIVNSQEDTVGIRMSVNDNALYNLLYNTFVSTSRNTAVSLPWHTASDLKNSSNWLTYFRNVID